MKKLLIALIVILSTAKGFAQSSGNDTTKYIYYMFTYGNALDRYWAKKVLVIPADTVYSKDGIALKNGVFYTGNGAKWSQVTGGGGGGSFYDSVLMQTVYRSDTVKTNLRNAILLKLNLSDSVTKYMTPRERDSLGHIQDTGRNNFYAALATKVTNVRKGSDSLTLQILINGLWQNAAILPIADSGMIGIGNIQVTRPGGTARVVSITGTIPDANILSASKWNGKIDSLKKSGDSTTIQAYRNGVVRNEFVIPSGGGGPPTGSAGGALSGTYPNPGIAKADGDTATGSVNGYLPKGMKTRLQDLLDGKLNDTTKQVVHGSGPINYVRLQKDTLNSYTAIAGVGTGLIKQYRADSTVVDSIGLLPAAHGGVPSGGTTGQALVKNSNANNDVVWGTVGGSGTDTSDIAIGNIQITRPGGTTRVFQLSGAIPTAQGGLPSGGTAGQVPTKNSNTSYDYSWAAPAVGITDSTALMRKANNLSDLTNIPAAQTNINLKSLAEKPIGTLYDVSSWPDTLDFTAHGNAVASRNGAHLVVGGGATLSDFLSFEGMQIYPRWTISADMIVTRTGFGMGIGTWSDVATVPTDGLIAAMSTSTIGGSTVAINSSGSGGGNLVTGTSAAFTVLDTFRIIGSLEDSVFTASFQNISTHTSPVVITKTFTAGGTPALPTFSHFAVFDYGSHPEIVRLSVTSDAVKNANLAVIGNSVSQYYYANSINGGYTYQLHNNGYGSVVNFSGSGGGTEEAIASMLGILKTHPRQILLASPSQNYYRNGATLAQVEAAYDTLAAYAAATGLPVLHCVFPEDSTGGGGAIGQTLLNAYIKTKYAAGYIDTYDSLSTNNILKSAYQFNSIHLNQVGNNKVYQTIVASGKLLKTNPIAGQFNTTDAYIRFSGDSAYINTEAFRKFIIRVASSSITGAVVSINTGTGSLSISPTTGSAIADINGGHANTWSAAQTFTGKLILSPVSGSGTPTGLYNNNTTSGYSITTLYPNSGANINNTFSLVPKGTGQASNLAAINLFNTDYVADATNFEYMSVRATGSGGYVFNASSGGTGTVRGMTFSVGSHSSQFVLFPNGSTSFGGVLSSIGVPQVYTKDADSVTREIKLPALARAMNAVIAENDVLQSSSTVAKTNFVSVTAPSDGFPRSYMIAGTLNIGTLTGGDVIQMQVAYTDENGVSQTGVVGSSMNSTGVSSWAPLIIRVLSGSVINVSTVLTTSTGTILYNNGATIVRLF